MPVTGVVVLLAAVGGLAAWTSVRVQAAKEARAEVSAQRAEDSKKALEALKATRKVRVVSAAADQWIPVVEIDGTLAAGQSAEVGFKVGGRIAQLGVKLGSWRRSTRVKRPRSSRRRRRRCEPPRPRSLSPKTRSAGPRRWSRAARPQKRRACNPCSKRR
jgi:hypothetical protein